MPTRSMSARASWATSSSASTTAAASSCWGYRTKASPPWRSWTTSSPWSMATDSGQDHLRDSARGFDIFKRADSIGARLAPFRLSRFLVVEDQGRERVLRKGRAMRAVILEKFGGPEHLVDATLPMPKVGADDVLIRVKAVGFNPTDYQLRQSGHPNLTPPVVLGRDVAGVVEACGGNVARSQAGRCCVRQSGAALARRLRGVRGGAVLLCRAQAGVLVLCRGGIGAGRGDDGAVCAAAGTAGRAQVVAGGRRRRRRRLLGHRLRQGVRHHAHRHHGGQRCQPRLYRGCARHRQVRIIDYRGRNRAELAAAAIAANGGAVRDRARLRRRRHDPSVLRRGGLRRRRRLRRQRPQGPVARASRRPTRTSCSTARPRSISR